MKKICFYTDSVFTLGGIQRIVTSICNSLYDYYDLTIVCQHKTKVKDRTNYNLNEKIKVKIIDNNFFISDTIFFAPIKICRFIIRKLKIDKTSIGKKIMKIDYRIFKKKRTVNFFNKEKFDFILAEGLECCIYLANLKQKINSLIIGCWHSSYTNYLIDHSIEDIRYSLEKLDKTIVLSNSDVKLIKENLHIDVDCIYNFINSKPIVQSNLENKIFISVGRYDKIKGYDRLIRIFSKFNQFDKNWKLLLVGDGPEKKNIKELVDNLNLNDKVIIMGKTDNVEKYYQDAAVFLFSSYGEGFPMVILEAMKYGLPIISFDIPVLHEMLPNDEYIIVQENEDEYLELIKKISQDIELRKTIGKQNANRCKKFYEEEIINQWKNLLK